MVGGHSHSDVLHAVIRARRATRALYASPRRLHHDENILPFEKKGSARPKAAAREVGAAVCADESSLGKDFCPSCVFFVDPANELLRSQDETIVDRGVAAGSGDDSAALT
jgi:hypothetical protein